MWAAGYEHQLSGRAEPEHLVVADVSQVQIASWPEGDVLGREQAGTERGSAVGNGRLPAPGGTYDGSDGTIGRDPPHPAVGLVDDVQVAVGRKGYRPR
jgi:hypothetical protein